MQQQTWEEQQTEPLQKINQIVQQQERQAYPLEQEIISEHYEQDFDPIQQSSNEPIDPQIQEELSQPGSSKAPSELGADELQNSGELQQQKLIQQCLSMQSQVAHYQAQILKRQQKMREDKQTNVYFQNYYQELLEVKKINEGQLQKQRQQFSTIITNRLGKETISQENILQDKQGIQKQQLEEKLIQEIVRIKALIHCVNNAIGKLRLSVKKNGEGLEHAEENNQEVHQKYRQLFRQAQTKKDKLAQNDEKINELDGKIEELHKKINQLQTFQGSQIEEDITKSKMKKEYEQLKKLKSTELKKTLLIKNSCSNAIKFISRSNADLHKQSQKVQVQLSQAENQNKLIEQKCQELLRAYKKQESKKRQRYQLNTNHFQQLQEQLSPQKSPNFNHSKLHFHRPRNFSVQRRTGPINSQSNLNLSVDRNHPFIRLSELPLDCQPSGHDPAFNQLENKLRESSTDGVLQKKFKLKLPQKEIPQGSRKFINVHAHTTTAKQIKNRKVAPKIQSSKLSVSERIENIQILEKQDKIRALRASRVYAQKHKQSRSFYEHAPLVPGQTGKDISKLRREIIKHQASRKDSRLNLLKTATQIKLQEDVISPSSPLRKSLIVCPQYELSAPQNLFTSIKQKLTLRESSALGSFKVDNPDSSTDYIQSFCNESTMGKGRLRQSAFIKKRSQTVRQKRLTEDYMRMLEEKGRRILELDNEGDA